MTSTCSTAHKYDILHLAQLAQTEIQQLCVHLPISKTDNFTVKAQGYALFIEELYGEFAEMLKDNRAEFVKSTSKIVAQHIRNITLDALTTTNTAFTKDVFAELAKPKGYKGYKDPTIESYRALFSVVNDSWGPASTTAIGTRAW
jgi:hypothetical protein